MARFVKGGAPSPPAALEALLAGAIDYAGSFPPASLPGREAFRNYESYAAGPDAWLLGRFVVSGNDLNLLLPEARGRFAVLAGDDQPRAETLEGKILIRTHKPFYWEGAPLDEVNDAGVFAKFRTGGVTPDAIPAIEDLADFILRCATLRLPFKLTAGLHHAVRGEYPLTYAAGAPRATMHGFLNVLLAACFARFGEAEIEELLSESDAQAFRFADDRAHWRKWSLSAEQIRGARREFVHSFGSCSFTEPVAELRNQGWL